jgi:hypothetical protein
MQKWFEMQGRARGQAEPATMAVNSTSVDKNAIAQMWQNLNGSQKEDENGFTMRITDWEITVRSFCRTGRK